MSPQEEAIATVNALIKVRVAPSKIHGVGVIAMRDIPKGVRLYATMFPQVHRIPYGSFGKLFPEIKEYIIERWPQVVGGNPFMWPDSFIQSMMNHSDKPNYDNKTDITLKDIKAGEEITEDYRNIENYEKAFPWLKKKKKKS